MRGTVRSPLFTFMPAEEAAVSFRLNTTDSPLGFDLTRIVSITGSGAGNQQRSRQNYTIEVAGAGSEEFVTVAAIRNLGPPGGEVEVSTTGKDSKPLARHVAQVRIRFLDSNSASPESMYREFDVYGVASE